MTPPVSQPGPEPTKRMRPGWRIVDPEGLIESECADRTMHQADVAKSYGLAIIGMELGEQYDWMRMNAAILARWPKGLTRVKTLAWRFAKRGTLSASQTGEPERFAQKETEHE